MELLFFAAQSVLAGAAAPAVPEAKIAIFQQ
jgi:hypothetical protein